MIQQMKNTFFHKLWLDCRDHSKHINIPTDSAPCINYVCHILQTMQNTLECNYYPHVDRQGVDISVRTLLFVCFFLCVCTVTDCSGEHKASGASNFARWLRGGLGRESPVLGNSALQKPKIGRIGVRRGTPSACVDNRQSPSLTVLVDWLIKVWRPTRHKIGISETFFPSSPLA